jgi:hypothetical protein
MNLFFNETIHRLFVIFDEPKDLNEQGKYSNQMLIFEANVNSRGVN